MNCSEGFNKRRERLLPLRLVSLLKNVERSFFVFSALSTSRIYRKIRLYFLKPGIVDKCNLLQIVNGAIRSVLKTVGGYCFRQFVFKIGMISKFFFSSCIYIDQPGSEVRIDK